MKYEIGSVICLDHESNCPFTVHVPYPFAAKALKYENNDLSTASITLCWACLLSKLYVRVTQGSFIMSLTIDEKSPFYSFLKLAIPINIFSFKFFSRCQSKNICTLYYI